MTEEMNGRPRPLVDEKTLADLGFQDVVKSISDKITFAPARKISERMRPIADISERKRISTLVGEIGSLLEATDSAGEREVLFDFSLLEDPTLELGRLEKGGVLTGQDLLKLEKIIPAYLNLLRLCRKRNGNIPGLKKIIGETCPDPHAPEVLEDISLEISAVLDEEGTIKDGATPELRQLRAGLRNLRVEIGEKVKGLMERYDRYLQDNFFTIRESRYVLPVRSEARTNVKGIIHGYSQSGATVYIEPEALIDDCNRLKIIEGEIRSEEEKILRHLSSLLGDRVDMLNAAVELLCFYDCLCAIVRFGRLIDGNLAELSDAPMLDLRQARHPLLLLGGSSVIPNDVELSNHQGWIISGPNAGGKTILLKTAGLCLLMAYCGIPIPAEEGSRIGNFETVRSVIGDDQSVLHNLSTFSAQVKNLAEVLSGASGKSLVLLDELASGTEPQEGAALAREILMDLVVEKGAAVMVATHFENLKHLSISHDNFVAAGMGFDFDSLSPTFKVNIGIPGISGGLVIAGKYGLPEHIVSGAKRNLEGSGDKLTLRIEEIETLKKTLEKELESLDGKKKEIKGKELEIESIKKKLIDKKRKELTAQEAYLTSELKLLHGELKEAHRLLRRRPLSKAAIRSTSRTAGKVSRLLAPEGKFTRALREDREMQEADPAGLVPGQRVFIKKLGLAGAFEGLEGKKITIRCGGKRIIVSTGEVFLIPEEPTMAKKQEPQNQEKENGPTSEMDEYQNPYNTLDVRGRALDESLIEIDSFIDTVMEMGLKRFYIIHGHGTGVLKNGIRRHLRHLKTVDNFRPGKREEGGDGCTVVKIKEM